ncbi:MAG: helix-turn-helix domain-containing protein [Lachnospiraceae bacterium]|nr:helix-turn-helix domain-containing protein [Lachnospiraceae bacterium]
MIEKTRPQGNFTPVSNEVFRDVRLNLTDRGLLTTLMSLKPNWDFTVEGMSAILPDGRGRIKSSLKRLERFGYITVIHEREENGRFARNRLIINSISGPPDDDEPSAENRPTDKRPADYREQYKNTNNTRTNNTRMKDEPGDLPQDEYEYLVSKYGKEEVDRQIKKIRERHYIGCMNRETIEAWCKESFVRKRKIPQTQFSSFEQRDYPDDFYEELERKLVGLNN